MIRFSAALVAVAIGVLIGGIASSELSLVYVAIAVSAVALVALAIGVVRNREELFGEGQGVPPVGPTQASPVPATPVPATPVPVGPPSQVPAGGGDDRGRTDGQLAPSPLQGAAVGPGAAFAGYGQAASARVGAAKPDNTWPSGPRGTGAERAPWPTPATAASFPAEPSPVPAAGWGATAAGGPSVAGGPAVAGGRAVRQGDAVQSGTRPGGGTDLRPWGTQEPVPASRTAESRAADPPASAGLDGQSTWFSPWEKVASADAWPARRPWLDEGPEGDDGTAGTADGTSADAPPTVPADVLPKGPVPDVPDDAGARAAVAPASEGDTESADAPPGDQPPADADAEATPGSVVPEAAETTGDSDEADDADEPVRLHVVRDPGDAVAAPQAAGEEGDADEPEGEQPDVATSDETGLVTVVRGVPRFHKRDCILIRFMPDEDTQQLPVAEAEEAGCTPCSACHPD